jgi:hypothetical protein
MIDDALGHSAFGAVVVGVAILGIVVTLVLAIRGRDAFSQERGGFWMFHGEADTSPHQMPGARFEERHVIDPDPVPGISVASSPSAPRPWPRRSPRAGHRTRRSDSATRC